MNCTSSTTQYILLPQSGYSHWKINTSRTDRKRGGSKQGRKPFFSWLSIWVELLKKSQGAGIKFKSMVKKKKNPCSLWMKKFSTRGPYLSTCGKLWKVFHTLWKTLWKNSQTTEENRRFCLLIFSQITEENRRFLFVKFLTRTGGRFWVCEKINKPPHPAPAT